MKRFRPVLFVLFAVIAGVCDGLLLTHGRKSISEHVWDLCDKTHALTVLGPMALLGAAYWLRDWPWATFVVGLLAGHLFWNY